MFLDRTGLNNTFDAEELRKHVEKFSKFLEYKFKFNGDAICGLA